MGGAKDLVSVRDQVLVYPKVLVFGANPNQVLVYGVNPNQVLVYGAKDLGCPPRSPTASTLAGGGAKPSCAARSCSCRDRITSAKTCAAGRPLG